MPLNCWRVAKKFSIRYLAFYLILVICSLLFPVCPWRCDRLNARLFQPIKTPFPRLIRFVGQERLHACEKMRQQGIGSFRVVYPSGCQMKAGRIAQRIACSMEVGR